MEYNEKLEVVQRKLSQEFEAQIQLKEGRIKGLENHCEGLVSKLNINESEKTHLQVKLGELTGIIDDLAAKNVVCEERLIALTKEHEVRCDEVHDNILRVQPLPWLMG